MFTFIAALNCALRISCFNRDTQFLKSLFPAKVLFPVMSYVFVFNSRFFSDFFRLCGDMACKIRYAGASFFQQFANQFAQLVD